MFRLKFPLAILFSVLLAACGGSSDDSVIPDTGGNDGGTGNGGGDTPVNLSSVTYFPMNFFLQGEGYVGGEVFDGLMFDPLVKAYVIAPVGARTLEPVTASINDFNISVNGQAINRFEQYAMLQKIVGLPVELNTAIIIDASGTARSQVNKASLISAVNAYFDAVISSTDLVIKNQKFTVWIYGDVVEPVTTFSVAAAAKTAAASAINTRWSQLGEGSSTYEAIVSAVGSYKGKSPTDSVKDYDMTIDGVADLRDGYDFDPINHAMSKLRLSNVVLIGAGGMPSNNVFNAESVTAALNWQSLIVYDTDADTESDGGDDPAEEDASPIADSPVTYLGKPLFFVHVGGNSAEKTVTDLASVTIDGSGYNFAAALIAAQQNSISVRSRNNNQHLVRFAVRERDGKHNLLFSSRSVGFNFGLTTELDLTGSGAIALPEPRVEITTENNDFLAGSSIPVSSVTRLYPATRYTTTAYDPLDYSWTVDGIPRAADPTNGSITISAADEGKDVVLTNNSLSTGTTTATLTITN